MYKKALEPENFARIGMKMRLEMWHKYSQCSKYKPDVTMLSSNKSEIYKILFWFDCKFVFSRIFYHKTAIKHLLQKRMIPFKHK